MGNLDADGTPDLAVANADSDDVSFLRAVGDGSFSSPVSHATGQSPTAVVIGDLNGDRKPDLAVANDNVSSPEVSILLGDGTGAFAAATSLPVGGNPFGLAIGDLNADHVMDLVVTDASADRVVALIGTGGGAFAPAAGFPAGGRGFTVALGDLNADGKPDVAVPNWDGASVSVLAGDGAGAFGAPVSFPAGGKPYAVAIGDLDADGRPDLAVTKDSFLAGNVSVLLNTSEPGLSLKPGGFEFGDQAVGTASPSKTVAVTNTGDAPLVVSGTALIGPDADEFVKSGDGCTGIPLAAGGHCTIGVRFAPVAERDASATLRILSNAPAGPASFTLTGTGTPAPPPPAGPPGSDGTDGAPGAQGAPGTNGTNGPAGAQGPAGTNGAAGANGHDGATGPTGPAGPQGRAGRDALVTCKPGKAKRGKVKVTCKVSFTAASSSRVVRARLSRGSHIYAAGRRTVRGAASGLVRLHSRRGLRAGRYRLLLTFADGRGNETVITQRVRVR
jgi:hypothetical protein